jgi:hypothetical protein
VALRTTLYSLSPPKLFVLNIQLFDELGKLVLGLQDLPDMIDLIHEFLELLLLPGLKAAQHHLSVLITESVGINAAVVSLDYVLLATCFIQIAVLLEWDFVLAQDDTIIQQ